MKIGIDARIISDQVTGIGRYTSSLTSALTSYPSEFILYSSSHVDEKYWQQSNVTLATNSLNSRALKMIWSQTLMPIRAAADEIDIFWGPSHRLPTCLARNITKVVTIHDLVWRKTPETMRPLSKFWKAS